MSIHESIVLITLIIALLIYNLKKLSKDTGESQMEILLKDKKPAYKVDEFGGYLYYQANDKTIYAYNLNK